MNSLLHHLAILDDKQHEMLELVRTLCDQNSGTMNLDGLAAVKQQLIDAYATLGGELNLLDCQPQTDVDPQGNEVQSPLGQAIHIRKRPDANRQVALCIHMDTVYAADSPFQQCRMLDNGTMNGPGVADAKGGLVVMLYALKALEASPLADQIGWEVLINPDEEIGSPGSNQIIADVASRCDFGLLFEPAIDDSTLVSWRKGVGNFGFIVRGKSAHAGRAFHEGRNAITAASKLAVAIDELNVDPEVTFNVGRISGGGALNVVPDLCIVRVNIRVKTPQQQQAVEQQLDDLTKRFDQQDGIRVQRFGKFTSPPKPITPDMEQLQQRIERCGLALGMSINWQGTGGASDGTSPRVYAE